MWWFATLLVVLPPFLPAHPPGSPAGQLLLRHGADAFWDGILSLDTSTLDKVSTLLPGRAVLLKVDRKNPHGPQMDDWRAVAKLIGEAETEASSSSSARAPGPSVSVRMAKGANASATVCGGATPRRPHPRIPLILAEVNCHNELWWNDRSHFNMDVAARFNVTFPADYRRFSPVVKLFKPAARSPLPPSHPDIVDFVDDFTQGNLLRFVQRHTNLDFRLPGTWPRMCDLARDIMLHAALDARTVEHAAARRSNDLLDEVHATIAGRQATTAGTVSGGGEATSSGDRDFFATMAVDVLRAAPAFTAHLPPQRPAKTTTTTMFTVGNPMAVLDAKHRLQRMLVAATKSPTEGDRDKPNKEHIMLLERKLNVLACFRSPRAATLTHPCIV